jgi:carbamoyltransferase
MNNKMVVKPVIVLGISAFYHDSAAALIIDGVVVAAVQEERFSRLKHDDSFPLHSIQWVIAQANIDIRDISYVVFYEKPFVRFERLLETYFAYAPLGFMSFRHSIPRWLKDKLFQKGKIVKQLRSLSDDVDWGDKLLFSDHHLSHAASAFYPSPFKDAAILTVDGVGEWATTSVSIGRDSKIELLEELHFPHSIGLLYSTITSFLGFKVNSGEYKVMGLAPYGKPVYAEKILNELLDLKADGSFRLNMSYFSFATDVNMAADKMSAFFGVSPRLPEAALTQVHKDIAASLQLATQEVLLKICRHIAQKTGMKNLCLAGGVALNCVANEKIRQANIFESIWIQPAAGDAGGALGAALAVYHLYLDQPRTINNKYCTNLGPEYSGREIEDELVKCGATYEFVETPDLLDLVAGLLSEGKVVGWMQGRAEFGPRALGNRSILADPRVKDLQLSLNLKIKFRESFRPFAPSVLEEKTNHWFDNTSPSTYMGFVALAHDKVRQQIPAVIHLDGTARLQTVGAEDNPLYYELLTKFDELTGCPLLVNTSFNVRGEPMVLSPKHAFECFMGTDIDILVVGNFILFKERQLSMLRREYAHQFAPD